MKLFDAHCHVSGNDKYPLDVIGRNIIFNTTEEYKKNHTSLKGEDVKSLIFDYKNERELLNNVVQNKEIVALKIHNRIQKISDADTPALVNALSELNTGLPVIYDAFYYGPHLNFQPSLPQLIQLIKAFPETNFIVAHCGGHHALDYLFHLRGLTNVYMDVSYSLSYLSGSSAYTDLFHLLKHTAKNRILFGTDFPAINATTQFELFSSIAKDLQWVQEDLDKVFWQNALEVFNL